MKLTASQISSLNWPKGATHLRVETPDGKRAVAARKDAPDSLDGVAGEWRFGIVEGKGKAEKFVPMAESPAAPEQEAPAAAPGTVSVGGAKEARPALLDLYAKGGYTKRDAAAAVSEERGLDLITCWDAINKIAGLAKKTGVVGSWVRGSRAGTGAGGAKRKLKRDRKACIKGLLCDTTDEQALGLVQQFRTLFAGAKAIVVRLNK